MLFSKLKAVAIRSEIREFLNNINGLSKGIINRVVKQATIKSSNDIIIITDHNVFNNICTLKHKNFNNYELEQKGTCIYGDVIFGSWIEDINSTDIVNS